MFKPTFLYIKQHSITGKLYFGKTSGKNVEKYKGSGIHWVRHIKKHGREFVETLWYCLFLEEAECIEFAKHFSILNNIVESEDWLNLKNENGLDGGFELSNDSIQKRNDMLNSPSVKAKIIESNKITRSSQEYKNKISKIFKETFSDPSLRLKISKSNKRTKNTPEYKLKSSTVQREAQNRPSVMAKRAKTLNSVSVKLKRSEAQKEAYKNPLIKESHSRYQWKRVLASQTSAAIKGGRASKIIEIPQAS